MSVIIGVAPAGRDRHAVLSARYGARWEGLMSGGARGRTTPKIVDWYMEGKIRIDELITHTLPHERINEAFELMHRASIRTVVSSLIAERELRSQKVDRCSPVAICLVSQKIRYSHRIARAVCEAECLPRKELFEAWEVAR